jgi:hypothetical protein
MATGSSIIQRRRYVTEDVAFDAEQVFAPHEGQWTDAEMAAAREMVDIYVTRSEGESAVLFLYDGGEYEVNAAYAMMGLELSEIVLTPCTFPATLPDDLFALLTPALYALAMEAY